MFSKLWRTSWFLIKTNYFSNNPTWLWTCLFHLRSKPRVLKTVEKILSLSNSYNKSRSQDIEPSSLSKTRRLNQWFLSVIRLLISNTLPVSTLPSSNSNFFVVASLNPSSKHYLRLSVFQQQIAWISLLSVIQPTGWRAHWSVLFFIRRHTKGVTKWMSPIPPMRQLLLQC